ncbi:MAG: hypothetical protein HC911_17115 [Chloroflexaceae bacterium]|nr:hypothetical protein [Chloroflexaceae bacterium]
MNVQTLLAHPRIRHAMRALFSIGRLGLPDLHTLAHCGDATPAPAWQRTTTRKYLRMLVWAGLLEQRVSGIAHPTSQRGQRACTEYWLTAGGVTRVRRWFPGLPPVPTPPDSHTSARARRWRHAVAQWLAAAHQHGHVTVWLRPTCIIEPRPNRATRPPPLHGCTLRLCISPTDLPHQLHWLPRSPHTGLLLTIEALRDSPRIQTHLARYQSVSPAKWERIYGVTPLRVFLFATRRTARMLTPTIRTALAGHAWVAVGPEQLDSGVVQLVLPSGTTRTGPLITLLHTTGVTTHGPLFG